MLESLLVQALLGNTSPTKTALFFGSFVFYNGATNTPNNPKLVLELLNLLAEKDQVYSFEQFKGFLNHPPKFTEKEPKATDPEFSIFDPALTPKEKQVLRMARYVKAKKSYDQRNRHYSEIQKRSRFIAQNFNADIRGYFSFISDSAFASSREGLPKSLAEADRFFFARTHNFYLKDEDRKRHTYITAGSGHGKSITIETLIHRDLKRDYTHSSEYSQPAIVLIDPHGDLAKTCARFKINYKNDRLVYIKPTLSKKVIPTSNPLDVKTKDWDVLKNSAKALMDSFQEIMQSGESKTTFTLQMEAILQPCLTSLLQLNNASLVDLMRFMDDDPAEYQALLNHAKRVLTNPMQRETLIKDFNKDSYNPTKLSIKTKMRSLLNDDHFYHYLVGDSTFNLEELIDKRSFVVFDLSGLGSATKTIGQFITAQLTIIALKRSQVPQYKRFPIHLYIDEFQHFISPSIQKIVTEARKYCLYGTFSQQFCGQGMNAEMKRAIIGNSGIKISGKNEMSSLKTMATETGADVEELQNLRVGEFHVKAGNAPSIAVKVPRVPKDEMMSLEQWRETLKTQIDRYYRPIFKTPSATPEATEGTQNISSNITAPERRQRSLNDDLVVVEPATAKYKRTPKGEPFSLSTKK